MIDFQEERVDKFDPEGSGYDYTTATASGGKPDETGHWGSIDPQTGMVLKGKGHSTFHKTVAAEEKLGFKIVKGKDGRYYSIKPDIDFQPEASTLDFQQDPVQAKEDNDSSYLKQLIGGQAKSGMGIARALMSIPKHTFWAGVDRFAKNEIAYRAGMTPEEFDSKMAEAEAAGVEKPKVLKIKEAASKSYNKIVDDHKAGMDAIIRNHPEWDREPPENFLDLLTSPRKLSLAVTDALPLLAAAGITTAAGQPSIAYAMMYAAEGQGAADAAEEYGASRADQEKVYHIYGSVSALIESLQLKQLTTVPKGLYAKLLNRTVQKVARSGEKSITRRIVEVAAKGTLEEMSQGGWEEVVAKEIYDRPVEGGVLGFIDRRLQEGLIGAILEGAPAGGGAVAGQIGAKGRDTKQRRAFTNYVDAEEQIEPTVEETQRDKTYMKGFVARVTSIRNNADNIVAGAGNKKTQVKVMKEELGKIQDHYDKIAEDIEGGSELAGIRELLPSYSEAIDSFIESPTKENFEIIKTVSDAITELSTAYGAKIGEQATPSEGKVETKKVEPTPEQIKYDELLEKAQAGNKKALKQLNDMTQKLDVPSYDDLLAKVEQGDEDAAYAIQIGAYRGGEAEATVKEGKPKEKTKPLTKKRLLYLGHDIPRQLEWSEEQRRKFMKKTTGKESMKDMSRPEKKKYIEALNKELEKASKEFEEAVSQKDVVLEALIERNAGIEEVRPVEGLEAESYRSLRRKVGSQASNFYQDLLRVERMLEKLDNYEKGPIRDSIWKPIRAADEMAIEKTNVELKEFRDTIKEMGANPDTWLTVYEKVEGTKLRLTKSQKVGVAMLSQNEKGNAALKTGMGMTDAEILDVVKSLDSTEKKIMEWFLQKYEEQWPIIVGVAGRSGIDVETLKKEYRYAPLLKTDANLEEQTDFLGELAMGVADPSAKPEQGFIKERKRGARGKIELDSFVMYMQNIIRVNRFIEMAPAAYSVGKILNSRDVKVEIDKATHGHGSKILSN